MTPETEQRLRAEVTPVSWTGFAHVAIDDLAAALAALDAARAEVARLTAEVARLRGLTPELPPFPPEGGWLPRYGLRWEGAEHCKPPLSVPMPDGYWTPWHLAEAAVRDAARRCARWQQEAMRLRRRWGEDGDFVRESARAMRELAAQTCYSASDAAAVRALPLPGDEP